MTLVSTDWLNENLNKVKIIDASWHLVKNRNAIKEYNKEHIENAIEVTSAKPKVLIPTKMAYIAIAPQKLR